MGEDGRRRDDEAMMLGDPAELPARFRALPGAQTALASLGAGDEVYAVGGTVRDLWRGVVPLDIDLVVVGDVSGPAARLGAEVRSHPRFQTVTVAGPAGVRYDLAMARRETYSEPGALPDIAPAGIEEDLRRRDFTVNALAVGLSGPRAGELVCAGHAVEDLLAGRLRVLHPASFADDPTRLLRLARYGARLGFSVELETGRLARDGVRYLDRVSGPRIRAELSLAAEEADPLAVWARMHELGVDEALLPGLGLDDPEMARRALALLPADGDREALLLAIAGLGTDADAFSAWRERIGVSRSRVRFDGVAAALQALAAATTPAQIARVLDGTAPERAALVGALGAERQARQWLERLRHMTIEVRGEDLIAAGVAPGPAIARGLAAARAAHLDGRAPTRADQLAEALRAAGAEDQGD
jgi:tRNA nucleotidyltransferase (CCA-adding enzyme)